MAKDARFIMGIEHKQRYAFCLFVYAADAVILSILTSMSLHVLVCFIHLKMCVFNYLICSGWWNTPTLLRIQNLKVKSTFKSPHTLLFYTQSIFSTVDLHTVKSNHNVSLLCRVGDAGSGLPSCRTGFIWQKVDREGLHAGRSSRPLWDVILLHNMSATISECRFIFFNLFIFLRNARQKLERQVSWAAS